LPIKRHTCGIFFNLYGKKTEIGYLFLENIFPTAAPPEPLHQWSAPPQIAHWRDSIISFLFLAKIGGNADNILRFCHSNWTY